MNLKFFSQTELDQRMKTLAQKERDLLHEVLLTIKEIDQRRIYLELGYGSLFDYLVQGVGYSEGSAQRRIDAARLLKEVPQIAEKIQSGEIKLNQISLVQKAAREIFKTRSLTVSAEDKMELLCDLQNRNYSESQKQVAAFFDLPVIESSRQKVQADESVRLEFTLSKEAFSKLQRAQELLSHSVPSSDLANFLEHVCDRIIKQKTSSKSPRSTATVAVTSLSSATKKRLLSAQDCCQYKSPLTGKICGSKWFPQADHKHSQWAGGGHELENIQRLCARHNSLKYRKEAGIAYSS